MNKLRAVCCFLLLWTSWSCQIGVTLCKNGSECSLKQRCIDKRCQAPPQENNRPPIARAGLNQRVKKGGRVRLDASTSSDADLDRLSMKWSFVKKPKGSQAVLENSTNPQASFVADQPGTFEVKVTVTDSLGSSDDDSIIIQVNYPPQADAGGDQLVLPGATVSLQGGDSWDTDTEDTLSFRWKLIRKPIGSKAALQTPQQKVSTFFVDQSGLYFVELTVSDGLDSSTDSLRIQVANPKEIQPRLQALNPWRAPQRSITKVDLLGDSFILGAKVFLDDKEIPVTYRSKNLVTVTLDLRSASIGGHKIKLQNPGGNETEEQLFQVNAVPKPVLDALTPSKGTVGQTLTLNTKGNGFVVGAKIYFNNRPLRTKYLEMTQLSAQLSLAGTKPGKYEVFVENEPGKRSNSQLFEVVLLPPKPSIYSHRFLRKEGGTLSVGAIDTDYEYLRLYVRGLLPTTAVYLDGTLYKGKKEVQITSGTTGSLFLAKFSTKGRKTGYMEVKVGNASTGQVLTSATYRIRLLNPYVPSLRYPRFFEESGLNSSYVFTDRDYKYMDLYGSNFQGTHELFLDNKKYIGSVSRRSSSLLRVEPFSTKGLKKGSHTLFVRNTVKGKVYTSNTINFTLRDGRVAVIRSIYSSNNTTRLYSQRKYTFLRINGYNFRKDATILVDGVPHKGPIQHDKGSTIYLYQFSTENMLPGAHTIVVRHVVNGQNYDSNVFNLQLLDGNTPRIRTGYFRPSSRVYQNETYQVTLSVENVQSGAVVLLDGKKYSGAVQFSTSSILLPQFDTTGLTLSTHTLQVQNVFNGKAFSSNPFAFVVRRHEPPRITQITPPLLSQGQTVSIQVTGRYFSSQAKLFVNKTEVPVSSVTPYRIQAALNLSGWKPGRYEVYVQNRDGQKSNISYIYIAPNLGPTLFGVNPSEIHLSSDTTSAQTVLLYLYGSNLRSGAELYANQKLIGSIGTPTSSGNSARASVSLLALQSFQGEVSITVKNPDKKESNPTEITVFAPGKPELYQVSPSSFFNSTGQTLYIRGRGFHSRSQVLLNGKAISNAQYSIRTSQTSPFVEQFLLRLQASDILGFGETVTVEIRNPDGQTSKAFVLANYTLKKVKGPILNNVSPSVILAGSTQATQIYLSGQNFTPTSELWLNGKKVAATYVTTQSLRLTLPAGIDKVGAYQTLQVRESGKASNHRSLYFRRSPLVTNIAPPFLQTDAALQTLTVFASGASPGAQVKLFGKSFPVTSPSRIVLTLTKQDMATIKTGLHTFQIEQPGGIHKSPTAGLYVIGPATSP